MSSKNKSLDSVFDHNNKPKFDLDLDLKLFLSLTVILTLTSHCTTAKTLNLKLTQNLTKHDLLTTLPEHCNAQKMHQKALLTVANHI